MVPTVADEICVQIKSERDIVEARQEGRKLAAEVGFSGVDLTLIATAISEMARNIAVYAGEGEIALDSIEDGGRRGIMVVARDEGPGIADLERAMQDGFSTGMSLGLGLPGARRLMDELEVSSRVGKGTSVTMKKWKR
jgi:serine/threonine-protein kinase RsbT